ncbi:hypothetical protein IAR50_002281 [Cryptococcus sp. DSM 104548]
MADDDVTGTNTDTATPTDAAGQKNSVANQESKKETRTPETAESGNSTTQLWKQGGSYVMIVEVDRRR